LERPIVMQEEKVHRYLSLPITFNEEKDRYNVKSSNDLQESCLNVQSLCRKRRYIDICLYQ
ncbi:hypothetical protein E7X23_26605, partial [Bacteroides fragilis]